MTLESSVIAAFIASCRDEIMALKPGNVHVFAEGHGMAAEHFLASAAASAPALCRQASSVGDRIQGAVAASFAAVGMNTNLGILLLCAPLAAAAERGGDLRTALAGVLRDLDQADATAAFHAIAMASPGGLGAASQHDVHAPATVSLREAMAEAAPRDRIALQYVSDFDDIFTAGFDALAQARARGLAPAWIPVAVYLQFLSKFPDTHVIRKYGPETAERVRLDGADVLERFDTCASPDACFEDLMAFDARLKAQGLNPGTSADLTVATLFADRLSDILLKRRING